MDKFLRNKNAVGTGSFEWNVENKTYGYKNYFKIENGNQVTIAQDGGVDPTFTIGSGRYGVTLDKQGVTNDGLTIYWSNQIINQTGKPYYLDTRLLGLRNGVASLDANGKIPTYQLPSYVSDVLEFRSFDRFPTTGEVNKIYIALDTNKTYRWGGTVYVEIGSSLALGETSETAYAGDKGKRNADNITALQSEKLNRKSGLSVTPETLVYACEAVGAESSYADKFITASLENIGNSIPIRADNGAIYGRSSQVSEDPEIAHVLSYELITKAYADKSYEGKIETIDATITSTSGNQTDFSIGSVPNDEIFFLNIPDLGKILMTVFASETKLYAGFVFSSISYVVMLEGTAKSGSVISLPTGFLLESDSTQNGKFLSVVDGTPTWSDIPESGSSVTIRRW